MGEQLPGGPGLHHRTAVHHHDPVDGVRDHRQIVADQDQSHAQFADQRPDEIEDLLLDGHVEGGGRLVGDEQIGLVGERHRDHHPLALAAGELMRILVQPRAGVLDADQLQEPLRLPPRTTAAEAAMQDQALGHLAADGVQRIERAHRLLEHHCDAIAPDPAPVVLGPGQQVGAVEADLACHLGTLGQQAHQCERGHRLAAARLSDDPQGLTALECELDPAHRTGRTGRGVEDDLEPADLEQAHRLRTSRGSARSRSPSPSRFRPRTDSAIAAPGYTASIGWRKMSVCTSLSMRPHDGVGGCEPMPR